jgi:hypothetical protein
VVFTAGFFRIVKNDEECTLVGRKDGQPEFDTPVGVSAVSEPIGVHMD